MVLKVVARPHEEWNAGAVVAALSGRGIVAAIEHLPGAVLLEELRPGTPLVTWVRADRAGEADRVLRDVFRELCRTQRARRLLHGDLGLDARCVIGWTFAQAVLSAIWMIEDGSDVPQDAPAMRVARAARELLGC